jgi:hypothetical protein
MAARQSRTVTDAQDNSYTATHTSGELHQPEGFRPVSEESIGDAVDIPLCSSRLGMDDNAGDGFSAIIDTDVQQSHRPQETGDTVVINHLPDSAYPGQRSTTHTNVGVSTEPADANIGNDFFILNHMMHKYEALAQNNAFTAYDELDPFSGFDIPFWFEQDQHGNSMQDST